MDEIFQFERENGKVVMIKKINNSPSGVQWQIFSQASGEWLSKSETLILKIYGECHIITRQVLIEKKGNGTKE